MSSAHASLGAYATDALDGTEARDVQSHLTECEVCRGEFAEFAETVTELSRLVAVTPPPELRAAVMRSIAQIRPLPPGVTPAKARPPVERLRSRRAGRIMVAVAALAVVAALGAGGYALDAHQQLSATRTAAAEAYHQRQIGQEETAILQAPDAAVYSSRLQDGSSISYLVAKSRNAAMMISGSLADPGAGRTYQLWTLVHTATGGVRYVPDHTFGGGQDQRVVVTGDVGEALGIAVTIEPSGGSQQPTGEPDGRATF